MDEKMDFKSESDISLLGLRYFIERYGLCVHQDNGIYTCGAVQAKNEIDFIHLINEVIRKRGYLIAKKNQSDPCYDGQWYARFSKFKFVSSNDDSDFPEVDVFHQLGFCLSGGIEGVWSNRGPQERHQNVRYAFADTCAEILFDALKQMHFDRDDPLIHKTFWPENKKFVVCLTHDVDELKKTYQWITRPWKLIKNRDLNGLHSQFLSLKQKIRGHEPFWTFESLMNMENELGVKSSLFFLNETSPVDIFDKKTWHHYGRRYNWNDPHVTELMRKIHSEGWEVGLHGSYNSYKDAQKIYEEKSALEQIIQDKVYGGRQHNLNLSIPETWKHQEDAGLLYDSTLGYNDCIGFRWGTSFPFRPYHQKERRMLDIREIPMIIEDLPFFRLQNKKEAFLQIAGEVERHQGVLTLLWHHSVMNEHEYPGWGLAYKKMIKYCQKKNSWVTSAKEIAQWWREREQLSYHYSVDEKTMQIMPVHTERSHYFTIYTPQKFSDSRIINAEKIGYTDQSITIRTGKVPPGSSVEIQFKNKGNLN
jgi:hypothetical protein